MARPEFQLQIACANHLAHILPPDLFWTSRDLATASAKEGQAKKAQGCKAGLFDLEFWLPDTRRRLHVDLKIAPHRDAAIKKLTASQQAMIPIIERYGEAWDVAWSVASLEDVLTRHCIPWKQLPHLMTGEQRDIALANRQTGHAYVGPKRKQKPSLSQVTKLNAMRAKFMF